MWIIAIFSNSILKENSHIIHNASKETFKLENNISHEIIVIWIDAIDNIFFFFAVRAHDELTVDDCNELVMMLFVIIEAEATYRTFLWKIGNRTRKRFSVRADAQ